jgi:hypothetical protein
MSYLNWHVGMKVVCVNADGVSGTMLVVGSVYTVRALDENFVSLEEPSTWGDYGKNESGWYYYRFRPVQPRKTSIEVFTRILRNPHVRIKEDA